MKYINTSKKTLSFKINGDWVDIRPKEEVELSRLGRNVKGLKEVIKKVEMDFNKMTKDQINDYAAKNNIENVNSSMTKAEMISIVEGQNSEED